MDREAYSNLVDDKLKARKDAKLSQGQNFSRLMQYVFYGPENPSTHLLGEAELKKMNPQALVERIHGLNGYKHRILYYGPDTSDELIALLDREHRTPDTLKDVPEGGNFVSRQTPETRIFLAPYDAKNIYLAQYSNRGERFDPASEPSRQLYGEYFGGGMNSIVFQEMRESRGLAYSAWAGLNRPSYNDEAYYFLSQIASQNDKLMDAIHTFNDIIEQMPQSENAFRLAKEGMMARLRTERITKDGVLWSFVNAQDWGLTEDSRIKLYNDVQRMTLQDVVNFQQKWVKGRTYYYGILGNKKELDMDALRRIGPVTELTTEEIFGY